jgi:hypothetical protein
MSEPRVLRTLAIPLGIALVFLVFGPKLCQKAIVDAKQRQEEPKGLVIKPSGAAAAALAKLNFPPALDAARIEYFVEIDPTFAKPAVMATVEGAPVSQILFERHYIEKRADGTLGPTREGLINVNGAVDSSVGWVVPVAQRKFVSVAGIDNAGDGTYNVKVIWHWEPGALYASLLPKPKEHDSIATFAGGEGHWVLTGYVKEPDRDFR